MNKKINKIKTIWVGATAAMALTITLTNVSPVFADTLNKVPGGNGFVKLVTFNKYIINEGNITADIKIPKVEGLENKNLEDNLNKEFMTQGKELYDNLIKELPGIKDGHKYVGTDFSVKTDTDRILSIETSKEEIQASSYITKKHYTIDKSKQIVLTLPSLFKDDKYIDIISNNIKEQMRTQMKSDENKIYFLDQKDMPQMDFTKIDKNQDFYLNNKGELVICFNEYEVAPGYMGAVEFTIPSDIFDSIK